MKKKIMAGLLAVCVLMAMSACGGKDDETVVYDYDYDLSEYITLGDYIGLEYTPTEEFTRTDVQTGDTINLDYVGKIDGEEFDNGSTNGQGTEITVGSAGYIDGFETGLVGMKIGETKDLNLKFPDDYGVANLAGKDVVFTVTVNDIIVDDPETTDKAALWEKFTSGCEVKKYPEKELNGMKEQYKRYYQSYADQYGVDLATFLEQSGITEEQLDKNAELYAENMVAQDMALFQLARTENIEVTDEEYEAAKADMLAQYGCEDDAEFEENYGLSIDDESVASGIETTALLQKVLDFIYKSAKPV